MARYHIGKDGSPHVCKAPAGKCPLGGEHYASMAEATAAAEEAAVPQEDTPAASLDTGDDVHATVNYKPTGLHFPEDYQEYWDDHYGDDDGDDGTSNGSKGSDLGPAPLGGRRDPSGFIDYSKPETYEGTKAFLVAFGWDGDDV